MVKRLGVQELIDHTTISKYELDKNEPPLAILLAYARLLGIPVEQIIDDELELTIYFCKNTAIVSTRYKFLNTSRHGRVEFELSPNRFR